MRHDRLLVQDVLDAIDETISCTPAARADFDSDKFLRSHLLRQIQIIGEAVWRISKTIKDQHPEVPWGQIAGMRHALVHDYFEVDWNEVYNTTIRDIPALKGSMEAVLAVLPPEEP